MRLTSADRLSKLPLEMDLRKIDPIRIMHFVLSSVQWVHAPAWAGAGRQWKEGLAR
jgi:hypothetical protein